jgi:energy-coupling factor transport system ATP-binding protein
MMTVGQCAYVGALIGLVKRRGRGMPTIISVALCAGAIMGALSVGALLVLSRLRNLIFEAMTANVNGTARFLSHIPYMEPVGNWLHDGFPRWLTYWPWVLGLSSVVAILVVTVFGFWALSGVLRRLSNIPDAQKLDTAGDAGPVDPLPIRLADVTFRYPHSDRNALGPVTLEVAAGEHVAVTGPNGSGKTTLMLVLAGQPATTGTVERPGAVGLGKVGGTAVVMQHPESQILGTRVADDVVWGLPPSQRIDVSQLLDEVGLGGLAERDTGGLSGGELQRLAVAAALAREPSLLIADEITSMVDQPGRDALLALLSGLRERHQTALVHITHYNNEADSADRIVNLTGAGITDNTEMVEIASAPTAVVPDVRSEAALFEVDSVSHEYASGTPWATTALRDVSFDVHEGDGLLIHGGNGSGKSTLAWIMAGLTVPTAGSCRLDGRAVSDQVGAVAMSFQAARLQLMRGRVGREVASAGGFSPHDTARVEAALATVGLDGSLAGRRIDQLSGGQMRRVVLAGLLERSPRALILDEPLAGVDAVSQRGLLGLLEDLRRRTGLTVIVISHDFAGLEELCPQTLHLADGVVQGAPARTGGAA